jgi:N-acetylmuramoyl-L-alanine amidase
MKFIRYFCISLLIITISLINSHNLYAKDGCIYVMGEKLDTLYRFKHGEKFFPIKAMSSALGFKVTQSGSTWELSNTCLGDVNVNEKSSNVLIRDGIVFASEKFWTDVTGIAILSKGTDVHVFNRIISISQENNGLLIKTAVPIEYSSFSLDDPDRTVYNFKNLSVGESKGERKYQFENTPYSSMRIGQFESFPHTGRLVIDQVNPDFRPVVEIHGDQKNLFWIGNIPYKGSVENAVAGKSQAKDSTPAQNQAIVKSGKCTLKVLIDPGHGGYDPGAIVKKESMGNFTADEKDVDLKLAIALGEILTRRGVQVYYTRTDDRFIDLAARRDMASLLKVDLLVSIHTNSTPTQPQSFAEGPEIYYHYARDKKLAQTVWEYMCWRTGVTGRGTFFCRFLVTMNPSVPSILVETAYLNNPIDLARLMDPLSNFSQNAMLGVADGIMKSFPDKAGQIATSIETSKPSEDDNSEKPNEDRDLIDIDKSKDDENEKDDGSKPGFGGKYTGMGLDILPPYSDTSSDPEWINIFRIDQLTPYTENQSPGKESIEISDTVKNDQAVEIIKPAKEKLNPPEKVDLLTSEEKEKDAINPEEQEEKDWNKEEVEKARKNIFKLAG